MSELVQAGFARLRYLSLAVCGLSGFWLLLRFTEYAHGSAGVRAYHVEAAATIFVALVFLFVTTRPGQTALTTAASAEPSPIFLAGFLTASLLLYWPAVGLGFFSDDFVLLGRVEGGQYGAASTSLMRPLVMFVWGTLKAAHLGPSAFHLLNIALHGVAAYLTSRVAAQWLRSRSMALIAGAVVLTHPAAVEPVVWVSGAFDLLATTLVLCAVLISRRYGVATSQGTRLALFALAISSVMAKETAVVAAVLIGLDAWIRRGISRLLMIDTAIIAVVSIVYSLIRLQGTAEAEALVLSKYTAQRALFQTFGGLGQPWQEDVRATAGATLALVLLVGMFVGFAARANRGHLRLVVAAVSWILVAIAPVAGWIMIGAQSEGTRYLYLALPAWGGLLGLLVIEGAQWPARIGKVAIVVGVALNVVVARHQIGAWSHAAVVRDGVLSAVVADARVRSCEQVHIGDLPDAVRGAFVFRNGASEALRELGMPRLSEAAPDRCRFRWDQTTATLR